ncbi:heat shock protein beta-11-like [Bufo gargarizans]|uniref:heat shock protein beta-11-like n=1 Tax=Bufo gargarizans TaxID=30331 RepID=UPI001CF20A79|nr:heat shock protein beta-11-like [Bufo gargarizans]
MLCLHLQRNNDPWRSFIQPLWPASGDLFTRMEQDMIRTIEDLKANIRRMDLFHQQLMKEMVFEDSKFLPLMPSGDIKSSEGGFTLCLGVQDFSPNELTVKLYGRKLLVTGTKETKNNDGNGSYSYKCQIFRKEADLPQDVRAEDISCILTSGGQLKIEAPWQAAPALKERNVPIQLTSTVQTPDQKLADGNETKDNQDSKP